MNHLARVLLGVSILLIFLHTVGCEQKRPEGLSPQVTFLWQQHPSPYPEEGARRAAAEAKTLLADHDDDIELHIYYIDRLRKIEGDSLQREYQRRLDRDPNNAVNIVLEAYVRRDGPYLVQVMPAAVKLDSTTAEVLAFGCIAKMGGRDADSAAAGHLATRALELHPNNYQANLSMANWQNRYGSVESALKYTRIARELNPWRWEAYSLEYLLLMREDRETEAVAMVEDYFASQPTNYYAYRKLSRYYEKNRLWKKLYDLEMFVDAAYPEKGYSFSHAADAAYRMEDYGLIIDAWMKAADYGFFDLDYLLARLKDEDRHKLKSHERYEELIEKLAHAHTEAQADRKAGALNRPLELDATDFTARDLANKPVQLSQYRGQIVVLDFWSTTEQNHPILVERLKTFREEYPDVQIISVDIMEYVAEDEKNDHIRKVAAEQGIDWPVWVADEQTIERLRLNMAPIFGIVDEQGIARYRIQGYHPYMDEILGWWVDAIRSGEAVKAE